jgi:sulfonate transport system ATP-binding protein
VTLQGTRRTSRLPGVDAIRRFGIWAIPVNQIIQGVTLMGITAINVRNQFRGKVKEIIRGPVVSEVDVDTPFGIVTSVITTRSVDELELKVGADVVALVKSTEVSIARL